MNIEKDFKLSTVSPSLTPLSLLVTLYRFSSHLISSHLILYPNSLPLDFYSHSVPSILRCFDEIGGMHRLSLRPHSGFRSPRISG